MGYSTSYKIDKLINRIYKCLHGDKPGEHIDPDEASNLLDEACDALSEQREDIEDLRRRLGERNSSHAS